MITIALTNPCRLFDISSVCVTRHGNLQHTGLALLLGAGKYNSLISKKALAE